MANRTDARKFEVSESCIWDWYW